MLESISHVYGETVCSAMLTQYQQDIGNDKNKFIVTCVLGIML